LVWYSTRARWQNERKQKKRCSILSLVTNDEQKSESQLVQIKKAKTQKRGAQSWYPERKKTGLRKRRRKRRRRRAAAANDASDAATGYAESASEKAAAASRKQQRLRSYAEGAGGGESFCILQFADTRHALISKVALWLD
jgi:hypothetical protein